MRFILALSEIRIRVLWVCVISLAFSLFMHIGRISGCWGTSSMHSFFPWEVLISRRRISRTLESLPIQHILSIAESTATRPWWNMATRAWCFSLLLIQRYFFSLILRRDVTICDSHSDMLDHSLFIAHLLRLILVILRQKCRECFT